MLGVLLAAGCGARDQQATQPAVMAPEARQVVAGYTGDALATATPTLRLHTGPGETFAITEPAVEQGATVFVRATAEDAATGRLYADIGRGFVDARWLERALPMPGCQRAFDSAYAAASVPPPTRAVLSLVAYAEGTGNCYQFMFGYKQIIDYKDHPRQCQAFGKTCTTAAGRYQLLARTWDDLAARLKLASFEPKAQDGAAQELLTSRGFADYGEPLSFVRFKVGIEQISWEWASLPPSRYGQNVRPLSALWERYQRYLKAPEVTP